MTKHARTYELDCVVADLRARIHSPEQRTDHPVSILGVKMRDLGIGGMMEQARELAQLAMIVGDTQTTDPERQMAQAHAHKVAQQLYDDMEAPAEIPAESVASEEELETAELALGLKLPASLRRIYSEVANGGFGPCRGMLPLREIVTETLKMRRAPSEGFPFEWPANLIVIEEPSPYSHNLDVATGEVIAMDGDQLAELDWDEASQAKLHDAWSRSFEVVAPNLESWLGAWIAGPHPEEIAVQEAVLAKSMADAKVHWRAQVERGIVETSKKSVEERRAMGLSDTGWEDEMRRGAGVLDPD